MLVRLTIACALVAVSLQNAFAAEKLPVPTQPQLVAAQQTLDEVFGKDKAAAKTAEQKKQLAGRMLNAAKTTEEAHLYYCVLENVEELALAARDFTLAMTAVDSLAEKYEIRAEERRFAAYQKFAASAKSPADHLAVAQHGIALLDDAHAAENIELAMKVGKLAFPAAKKGRDAATVKTLEERAAMLVAEKKAAESLRGLEALIEVDPNDRGAHQQLGEILCFTRNQWDKGLPHLAKGADSKLAELARRDLAAPADGKERVAIADAWLEMSKSAGKTQVAALQARSLHWYEQAAPGLTGLTKARVEKLVGELGKSRGAGRGKPAIPRIFALRDRALYSTSDENDDDQLDAIDKGLLWLVAHQRADGSWSFDHRTGAGDMNPGSFRDGKNGSTAMALLPLLSAGHTHKEGEHSKAVQAGLAYLGRSMKLREGGLGDLSDPAPGSLYSHSLAAVALCEAYGMTADPALREPAQAAMNYIAAAQDPVGGGWRYTPRQPGDTSVCGWQLQALFVGHHAGLLIPEGTLPKAHKFLDSVQQDSGASYGYTSPGTGPGTTAVGLYSRQLLGWKPQEQPGVVAGLDKLVKMGPSTSNSYFNYFATYALKNSVEHDEDWRAQMRNFLIDKQVQAGDEAGSWHIPGDHGADVGGRLYCTCMALLTLEANFRYAPQ